MKEWFTKHIEKKSCLMQTMIFFDMDFCRDNTADLAFAKMIIDCELHYRLYKIDNPDSGFIELNGQYWKKFNINIMCELFPIFSEEKLINLIQELFDRELYKIKGSLDEKEILILLE